MTCKRKILLVLVAMFALVSLTATGDAANEERFELDGKDLVHPIVQQRLDELV